MAKMHAAYDNYCSAVDDVRDEIIKMIEKYERDNFEDTEYYFGYVDGVGAAIKLIDDLMDKERWNTIRKNPDRCSGPRLIGEKGYDHVGNQEATGG